MPGGEARGVGFQRKYVVTNARATASTNCPFVSINFHNSRRGESVLSFFPVLIRSNAASTLRDRIHFSAYRFSSLLLLLLDSR